MTFKKKVLIILAMLAMVIASSGCIMIQSDVTVKGDLTGVWKAKVFSADPSILNKAGLEEKIKEAGITNYKITEATTEVMNGAAKKTITGFEVTLPWKNNDELKRIVVLGRAATVGGNQNGKINVSDPIVKDEQTGEVTLNLGNATPKMTLHIDGSFDKTTLKDAVINKDGAIEYTAETPVVLKFKPNIPIFGSGISMAVGGIVLLAGGVLYYQRKNKTKDATEKIA